MSYTWQKKGATGIYGFSATPLWNPKRWTKHIVYMLMYTMALAYIICDVMVAIWGYRLVSTPLPQALKGAYRILGVPLPKYYLAARPGAVSSFAGRNWWACPATSWPARALPMFPRGAAFSPSSR